LEFLLLFRSVCDRQAPPRGVDFQKAETYDLTARFGFVRHDLFP
jgi:hypothetical protein